MTAHVRGHPEHGDGQRSLLDRRIELSAFPIGIIPWLAVFLVALMVRLIGRTNWPLSPREAEIASDALALIQGYDLSSVAFQQPFLTQSTALAMFLFGDTDYTARLVPLVAGMLIIGVLFWRRAWLGNLPALVIALLVAISPTLTFSSLRLDGGGLLLALLALLVALLRPADRFEGASAVTLGVVAALALTADPLAWIALPLAVAGVLILRRPAPLPAIGLLPFTAGLFGALTVVTTFFATRPSGVIRFFQDSMSQLWHAQLATLGDSWFLTIMTLVVEEPSAVVFSIVAVVALLIANQESPEFDPRLIHAGGFWALTALLGGTLLGGKGPALYALTALPFLMVGGVGLAMTISVLQRSRRSGLEIALFILALAGMSIVLVRLIDQVAHGPGGDAVAWILNVVVILGLIAAPLAYLLYRALTRLQRTAIPATLLALALVLALAGLRSSLLLPMTATDRPGEFLVAGSSAPSVTQIVGRVERYSRDVTALHRDVRDPTGGHGLTIVVDQNLHQPFAWYFRRFPNLTLLESDAEFPDLVDPDLVIASPDASERYLEEAGAYDQYTFVSRVELPAHLADPDWFRLTVSAVNPFEYRDFVRFVIYRSTVAPAEVERFSVLVREDHAGTLWGVTPP